MRNDLSQTAMLIAPVIHTFYNTRTDVRMKEKAVNTVPGMTTDDSVMRSLLPSSEFKAITAAKQAVRKCITKHTMPWTDSSRILPAANIFTFQTDLDLAIATFHNEADILAKKYPALKKQVENMRGDLFDENDYPPTPADFRARFYVELNITPFPNVDDFRLQIPEELMQTLRDNMTNEWTTRVNDLRVNWVESMRHKAALFVESPSKRRLNALNAVAVQVSTEAPTIVPDDDIVLGICRSVLALPTEWEAAILQF